MGVFVVWFVGWVGGFGIVIVVSEFVYLWVFGLFLFFFLVGDVLIVKVVYVFGGV